MGDGGWLCVWWVSLLQEWEAVLADGQHAQPPHCAWAHSAVGQARRTHVGACMQCWQVRSPPCTSRRRRAMGGT